MKREAFFAAAIAASLAFAPLAHAQQDDDGDDDPHAGMGGGMGAAPRDAAHAGIAPGGGGGAHAGHAGGMFEAPEDGSLEDPTLPAGTIEIHLADAEGKPLPHEEVTLGIIYNSVAKGENRKRVSAKTNDVGAATFDKLDFGSGVAYRALALRDGATFSAPPFALSQKAGERVLLHVYPVEHDVEKALVVFQSLVYTEVKDDRVQIQEQLNVYNFGKTAWVPSELVLPRPETFTAFTTQQGMTDVGVDEVAKKGVRLRGTFAPGQHQLQFRWQVPYNGDAEVRFEVGEPPHLAAARLLAPASRGMTLEAEGFPPAQPTNDGMGQHALVTERQLRRDEPPLRSVTVVIKGLPTEGPGKVLATFLAACGVVAGVVLVGRKSPPPNTKNEQERLLAALEDLERAHQAGDVGPKTYERMRRELLDDLARAVAAEAA